MRCISWNVNGLRAVLKKNFYEVFDAFQADIFALQETKCHPDQVELDVPGYYQYWSSAVKKGYSGTAVLTRTRPVRVLHGLGDEYLDQEGRIVALEFDDFWFVDVYTPNSQNELARIDHRMQWDDAFRDFCKGLELGVLPAGVPVEYPQQLAEDEAAPSEKPARAEDLMERTQPGDTTAPKPVIMCGDFNVAHNDIDLKNASANRGASGFSDEERGKLDELIDAGFVDTFRMLHPDQEGIYTWWSYRFRARRTNAGWRIDYFFVSDAIAEKVCAASIYDDVEGSDHCPVGLDIEIA